MLRRCGHGSLSKGVLGSKVRAQSLFEPNSCSSVLDTSYIQRWTDTTKEGGAEGGGTEVAAAGISGVAEMPGPCGAEMPGPLPGMAFAADVDATGTTMPGGVPPMEAAG